MFELTRCPNNPIFSPDPSLAWEKEGVFNPGVTVFNGEILMLYRAVGERESYISHMGMATSKDGINFERISKEPIFGPSQDFDKWATEDPRITKIGDTYYITYVAVDQRIMDNGKSIERTLPLETATALLKTKDFKTFENLGIITPKGSDNKDVVFFSEKINGRYAMLHRPNRWTKEWFRSSFAGKVEENIPCSKEDLPEEACTWIAFSDDMVHWDSHHVFMTPSHSKDVKNGPGVPPILTPEGWLIIYQHVRKSSVPNNLIYTVHIALFDRDNPRKLIAKLPRGILDPKAPYETENGCHIVFPTGAVLINNILHVYYGASDKYVCLATASLDDLLDLLRDPS
jgi:beta-1,2-mannobiose phosphorylase / 1,2-beta-oligomannan phosphorylase